MHTVDAKRAAARLRDAVANRESEAGPALSARPATHRFEDTDERQGTGAQSKPAAVRPREEPRILNDSLPLGRDPVGGNDYLTKPLNFSELQARVRALIRRDKVNKGRIIRADDIGIDTGSRIVKRGGHALHLTPREYALLEALAVREGTAVSRETIQSQAWMDDESYSNLVDVYVGMLRKKIDSNRVVKLIQTVHGIGYTFDNPGVRMHPR